MTATIPSASELVLVDSSGWVAFLGGLPQGHQYAPFLADENRLIVPTIILYEVFKKIRSIWGEVSAHRFLSHALRARVIPLDATLALAAADLSAAHRLPMADAIIYATAQSQDAQLVTSDSHFKDLPGVTLV